MSIQIGRFMEEVEFNWPCEIDLNFVVHVLHGSQVSSQELYVVEQRHGGSQDQERNRGYTEVGDLWARIGKQIADNSETQ